MAKLSLGQIERIKLTANFTNTMAAGLLVSGVVVPIVAAVYAGTEMPRWNLGVAATIQAALMVGSLILHNSARYILRELDR